MTVTDQDRQVRRGRVDSDASCACTSDGLCLLHYGELDPGRQAAVRRQAGVSEPRSRYGAR